MFKKSAAKEPEDASMSEESSSAESGSDSDASDDIDPEKAKDVDEDAMIQDEEEEDVPRGGLGNRRGIGSRSGLGMSFAPTSNGPPDTPDESHGEEAAPQPRGGIGARRGIGASSAPRRGMPSFAAASQAANPPEKEKLPSPIPHTGIGARPTITSTQSAPAVQQATTNELPTSFAARAQRAFVRNTDTSTPPPTKPNISAEERAHFDRISGSFGARLMAKMGWQAGTGLGAQGQGIVTPVESKLRPKGNVGIAYGGFKERTKQAVAEDRRKGIKVSDDEDEKPKSKRKGHRHHDEEKAERSEAWKKKSKPKKTVVEHRTYEEILREAGVEAVTAHQAGVGPIIDATGATPREVSSIAALSSWTPSTETMRLPELRHNLRLMVDMTNHDLNALAREGKLLEEKKRKGLLEEARLSKKIQEEAELIRRLGEVNIVVEEIASVSKETQKSSRVALSSDYESSTVDRPSSLEALSPFVERFLGEFSPEYEKYRLDEVVVASIAPLLRLELADWRPLEQPVRWTAIFTKWRAALKMSSRPQDDGSSALVSIYDEIVPTARPAPIEIATAMTPWEALLWHSWLPKVRSAINNEWDASDAAPVIALYEAWYDLIPPFMQDNFLDQLVLPKVERAMADWKPVPGGASLHDLVFPWLPHVGLRMEEYLGHARRNVRRVFRSVDILAGPPQELLVWKPMMEPSAWQDSILKYIVPRLGELLRDDFRVNPRKQDLKPLEVVIAWFDKGVIGNSIMNQLVEKEVFPKWLEALHIWLSHPQASYGEIAEWYDRWRTLILPENVLALDATQQGFHRGLQMMEDAMKLGEANISKLPKPSSYMSTPTPTQQANKPVAVPKRTAATDFKSIAEEHAQAHDLLFMPTGRVHVKVRLPMYRVTGRGDGKGGIIVYILDDAVWLVEGGKEDGESRAIPLREMVLLASKAS